MTERTANLVRALISYLPPAVARSILDDPQAPIGPRDQRYDAAVLLADVSGFTALTERLARLGGSGVEELMMLLNRYFSRMISLLEAEGGEVVQFSGDALLAVFPVEARCKSHSLAEAIRRAWQAASRMQESMSEFGTLATSVGEVGLGMKIAIGAGEVLSLSVGGALGRWQYVVAGDPLRQVAEAEEQAKRGQIVLSTEARELFNDRPLQPIPLASLERFGESNLLVEALRSHIPGAIGHRLLARQSEWLAELRPMTIIFIGIGGIDYAASEATVRVQECMAALQQMVYRYEGSINKLVVDDKGTIGIALFGAPPLSHEDDPLRAVRCALDLQQIADDLGLRMAIGITSGQVFAGPIGSERRREYTVIGDAVNLAARLMGIAGRGRILCDHTTLQATHDDLRWLSLPAQKIRGKAEVVMVYQPLGLQPTRHVDAKKLIGRAAEQTRIVGALEQAAHEARILCIEGDTGIGKSRLIAEIDRLARERGVASLLGSGQSLEQQTPYRAWRPIFSRYFGLDEGDESADRSAQVLARLAEIAPGTVERAPLLNDLLGLSLPENSLTQNLEPKLRQASLQALLGDLLAIWAHRQPLTLILDDAHWLDSLSWQLVLQTVRSLVEAPLLLVLALRPSNELPAGHPYHQLRSADNAELLALGPLRDEETAALVAARLGVAALPQSVADLIARRSAGNPFVAEELTLSLRDGGMLIVEEDGCRLTSHPDEIVLPETVQGLVLSRIDRLPPEQQTTIKIASVIGRSFSYATLRDIYPPGLGDEQLQGHLDSFVRRDLMLPPEEYVALQDYAFKQVITQEVTYSTLLHTQRRELHAQVARWYEQHDAANQTARYPLLAYHWQRARDGERERYFATLAGKSLAAEYANAEAIAYLSRALDLTEAADERFDLLWQRLQVYERIGEREAQRGDLVLLQTLVDIDGDLQRQAQVANAWAALYRDLSDYPAAIAALTLAQIAARQIGDTAGEARSLTLWGQVMEHQGAYVEARGYYEQALALYRRIGYQRGEANNLSNLGNIHFYMSDYRVAQSYDLQALDIRRTIGDRAGEAASLSNLSQASFEMGDLAVAQSYRQQALELARTIGDRSSELLCLDTMGYSYLVQGDYEAARQYLEQAVHLAQAIGERRSEANCLNMLGWVWRDVGNYTRARPKLERALAMFREVGELSFAAYTCLNLGYVLLPSDPPAALSYYEQALGYARTTENRDAEAYAFGYRGFYHEQQGSWEAAGADYRTALEICRELDAAATAVEHITGLARVALGQGRSGEAARLAHTCLDYLEEHGITGMEFPLQVYLTCYDSLRAVGERLQAHEILDVAYAMLLGRARMIGDPLMRASMIENVEVNRRIVDAWSNQEAAGR